MKIGFELCAVLLGLLEMQTTLSLKASGSIDRLVHRGRTPLDAGWQMIDATFLSPPINFGHKFCE